MSRRRTRSRAILVASVIAASGCGGGARPSAGPAVARTSVAVGAGRPRLTVVERQGDAHGAVAIAVTTDGIAADRGAMVAVALGSLVEERLAASGVVDASVVAGWDGWRLRALVATPGDGAKLVDIAREAMLAPVGPKDAALAAVTRKLEALSHRPLPDRALLEVARCTGEAYGAADAAMPSATELDAWRRAAHGLARIAVATAGEASLADAVAAALSRSAAWPAGLPIVVAPRSASEAPPLVYDASGEIPPGAARIVVTARTTTPEQAVAAAPALGDPHGPLASRLAALDAPGRLRSVVATRTSTEAASQPPSTCRRKILLLTWMCASPRPRRSLARSSGRNHRRCHATHLRHALAMRAADPRDAADTAAWWEVSRARPEGGELRSALTVGVAAARDVSEPSPGSGSDRAGVRRLAICLPWRTRFAQRSLAPRSPGKKAYWRLAPGSNADREKRGCSLRLRAARCPRLFAMPGPARVWPPPPSWATRRTRATPASNLWSWRTPFAVLVHGPARAGESSQAHARRLADLAGGAFAAEPLDAERMARARATLLARAGEVHSRGLGALATTLAPGHPSVGQSLGDHVRTGPASDDAIAIRRGDSRRPAAHRGARKRDQAQADAAVRAAECWIARRPGEARACPPLPTPGAVRSGTYAVELPTKTMSEALLAIPLPLGDDSAFLAARWTAAAIDGPNGLIARALGGSGRGNPAGSTPVRAWSSVLGSPRAPAIVIRLVAPDPALDSSVAQARATLERLRQGALTEADQRVPPPRLRKRPCRLRSTRGREPSTCGADRPSLGATMRRPGRRPPGRPHRLSTLSARSPPRSFATTPSSWSPRARHAPMPIPRRQAEKRPKPLENRVDSRFPGDDHDGHIEPPCRERRIRRGVRVGRSCRLVALVCRRRERRSTAARRLASLSDHARRDRARRARGAARDVLDRPGRGGGAAFATRSRRGRARA